MSRKWRKAPKPIQAAKPALPPLRLTAAAPCAIQAAEGEKKLPTFEGLAYTGAAMRPLAWYQDVIIDLQGVQVGSQKKPALKQHDHDVVVGHTTSVNVDKDGIHVAGVFSGEEHHRNKVVIPAQNDFEWQLSVGADPITTEQVQAGKEAKVNGRVVKGPVLISRKTKIGEISFVALGADDATSVSVAASKGTPMTWHLMLKGLTAALRAAGKKCPTDAEIDNMSADEARQSYKRYMKQARAEATDEEEHEHEEEDEEDPEEDRKKKKDDAKAAAALAVKATREATAAELTRCRSIQAAARKHGVTDIDIEAADGKTRRVNVVEHAIAEGWSANDAELAILRASRPGPGVGVPGGLAYVTNQPQMNEAVLEAACLHAARHQFRLEDDGFYFDTLPGGYRVRRVPEYLERETRAALKARYTDQVQQAAHTAFRGQISPRQLLTTAFRANGERTELSLGSEMGVKSMLQAWDHMEQSRIRAEGASNLSISNILANVLNKFALQGYLFVEQAWREISGIIPVNDFKATKSINLLGDVIYKALGPVGELANASLGDQAFANQAQPYGRIVTIPWTHIVNDDLGMLTGVPVKLGQGAGLALNDYFWALWASLANGSVLSGSSVPAGTNLNGDDGNAFWRTSSSQTAAAKHAGTAYNKNKLTTSASALQSTALQTAKAAFDNQTDPNGNPLGFDGSMPILLHPPTLWRTVMELLGAGGLVLGTGTQALQPNVNVWAGVMKPVMSRYLENSSYGNSATGWYILFNPAALPVIQVAFLNGVDTPAVLQATPDYQFDRLGISIRGTMPFGVTQQNFRGGVYNAGV